MTYNKRVEIINPLTYANWNKYILSADDYSFFHSSNWAEVICSTYHYKPLYFSLFDKERIVALLPLMEIKSFISGQRGVSLPFTDFCSPIISKEVEFNDILNYLVDYGRKAGWKYIEIRGDNNLLHSYPDFEVFYGHRLALSETDEHILSSFRSSTKRNIQKALKAGVEVNILQSYQSIKEFYRMQCITRKMHGLPPQPLSFFNKIYKYVIKKNSGFVVLASYEKKYIAGAVFFSFGNKALYKYGASDRGFQHLRANNIVMWKAIQWYCQNGYKYFYFGRTEPENNGLRQYKNGWGVNEYIIRYYRYDLRKDTFIKGKVKKAPSYTNYFKKMPIPFLRLIGSLLYKHIG